MASIVEVKTGISAGNILVTEAQGFSGQVAEATNDLGLEGVAADLDTVAQRLGSLAEIVGTWPVAPAQMKRSEADGQFSHTMQGGQENSLVQQAFSALGEMGNQLNEAGVAQASLREVLLALSGISTEVARRIREEAVPQKELVKEKATTAISFGTVVKEKMSERSDRL